MSPNKQRREARNQEWEREKSPHVLLCSFFVYEFIPNEWPSQAEVAEKLLEAAEEMAPKAVKDEDEFLEKVDQVSALVDGLRNGRIDPKDVDSVLQESASSEQDRSTVERAEPGEDAKEEPARKEDLSPEKRREVEERAEELKRELDMRQKAREKYEEYVKRHPEVLERKKQMPTDYRAWDLWAPEEEEEDLLPEGVKPQGAEADAMERDVEERRAKRVRQRQEAHRRKEEGNRLLREGQPGMALKEYEAGLASDKRCLELHSNAAQACLAMGCPAESLSFCDSALELASFLHNNPSSPPALKALVRRSRARSLLGPTHLPQAESDLAEAARLAPGDKEILDRLERVRAHRHHAEISRQAEEGSLPGLRRVESICRSALELSETSSGHLLASELSSSDEAVAHLRSTGLASQCFALLADPRTPWDDSLDALATALAAGSERDRLLAKDAADSSAALTRAWLAEKPGAYRFLAAVCSSPCERGPSSAAAALGKASPSGALDSAERVVAERDDSPETAGWCLAALGNALSKGSVAREAVVTSASGKKVADFASEETRGCGSFRGISGTLLGNLVQDGRARTEALERGWTTALAAGAARAEEGALAGLANLMELRTAREWLLSEGPLGELLALCDRGSFHAASVIARSVSRGEGARSALSKRYDESLARLAAEGDPSVAGEAAKALAAAGLHQDAGCQVASYLVRGLQRRDTGAESRGNLALAAGSAASSSPSSIEALRRAGAVAALAEAAKSGEGRARKNAGIALAKLAADQHCLKELREHGGTELLHACASASS